MRYTRLVLVLGLALLWSTPSFSQAATLSSVNPTAGAVSTAVIRPGDAVQITVWRKPELSGEFFVANDGAIIHPFYQEVKVAGMSPELAAQRVQAFLEQYETSPRVRVDPLYRVSVGGEVRQPKLYTLRPEITISEAVDMAGGPTERGHLQRVSLYRDGQRVKLDLSGTNPDAAEMRVQSGDRIVVERRTRILREVVLPTLTAVGSVASLINVLTRLRR